jgi:hypothetical protein
MVEFGLALPILLLVVYGLIETGRLVFMYASVVSAARQAVRYGSVTGENGAGTKYYNDCAGIRGAAKSLGFLQPIQDSDIHISYDTGPAPEGSELAADCPIDIVAAREPVNGDRITVQVSTEFSPIVPLVPFEPFTITSTGTRTLLVGVPIAVTVPGVILTPGGTGAMALSKDANVANFDRPGQVIVYTYTLTNLGAAPVEGINMTDDKAGLVDCSGATDPLPGGASTSCTASYVVTQGDIDKGFLANIATATASSGGVPLVAQATLTIGFIPLPEITLVKEGHPPPVIETGNLATYTFTLTNTGNVRSCAGAASPIDVGDSAECTGTYAIKQADINAREVTNTATATGMYGTFTVTSNPSTTTVLIPELVVSVSASPPTVTELGETITFTYGLENRTANTMNNLTVTDTRGADKFACLTSLAPGEEVTTACTRGYSAYTQADMDAGFFINHVDADAQGNVHSNSTAVTVVISQNPELTLTKTASVEQSTGLGSTFDYSYSLQNTGNVTLTGPYAVSDDKIPTIDCTGATGSMAPGETKSCTDATYTVSQAAIDAGFIRNLATATASFGAVPVTSAEATTLVITHAGPRLGLEKSSTPAYFKSSNDLLNYTFTLKNTGGVPIDGPFSVSDDKIPAVDCSAAVSSIPVGSFTTCTGSYITSSTDNVLGYVTNTATATSATLVSDPSPTVWTVNKFSCISSKFKHAPPTPIQDGQNITWTIINNTGIPVHIDTATISWGSALTTLNEVLLGGVTIWNGPPSSSSGGFTLPGGPWELPSGNTDMQLSFSGVATGIRIVIDVVESGCNTVDSNVIYPD